MVRSSQHTHALSGQCNFHYRVFSGTGAVDFQRRDAVHQISLFEQIQEPTESLQFHFPFDNHVYCN